MKTILTTSLLFLLLTLATGVIYPLAVTGIAAIAFPTQARGSLVTDHDGKLVGSRLLAQKTANKGYFWPRPSAGDYATVSSAASHLAPTSAQLHSARLEREAAFRRDNALPETVDVPSEMLYASGSGLDPDISPTAARLQVARVAQERELTVDRVTAIIDQTQKKGGLLADDRVNVLELNLALDALNDHAAKPQTQK